MTQVLAKFSLSTLSKLQTYLKNNLINEHEGKTFKIDNEQGVAIVNMMEQIPRINMFIYHINLRIYSYQKRTVLSGKRTFFNWINFQLGKFGY